MLVGYASLHPLQAPVTARFETAIFAVHRGLRLHLRCCPHPRLLSCRRQSGSSFGTPCLQPPHSQNILIVRRTGRSNIMVCMEENPTAVFRTTAVCLTFGGQVLPCPKTSALNAKNPKKTRFCVVYNTNLVEIKSLRSTMRQSHRKHQLETENGDRTQGIHGASAHFS